MSDPRRIAHARQLLEEIGVAAEDAEVYLRILFFPIATRGLFL